MSAVRGPEDFKVIDAHRLTPAERGRQRGEFNRVLNRQMRARLITQPFWWYCPSGRFEWRRKVREAVAVQSMKPPTNCDLFPRSAPEANHDRHPLLGPQAP